MDRSSFLASLPFLIRLPSPAWPPHNLQLVVLAGDHSYGSFQLSVECGRRRNPAFFATSNASSSGSTTTPSSRSSSSDPAQTPVELVLCNPTSNDDSTSNGNAKDNADLINNSNSNAPVTAFLRVDGHVYALHLSAVRAMTMIPETLRPSDPDRSTQNTTGGSIATPPSLCLDFGEQHNIQLRFFRSTGTVDDCVEDRAFWNGVRDTLRDAAALEQFHAESLGASSAVSSSPERSLSSNNQSSSKTLSGVELQEDPTAAGSDNSNDNNNNNNNTHHHPPTKNDQKRPAVDEPHQPQAQDDHNNESEVLPQHIHKLQRRHQAARECTERMGWIRHILELPAEHFRRSTEHPPNNNDNDNQDHNESTTTNNDNHHPLPQLGPLLSQTVACWPESYPSADESHEAVRHYDTLRVTALMDMERTLQQSFPSRQRQRHRRSQQPPTVDDSAAAPPAMATTMAASTLEQLVEQHKQATVERYKLFLLPSRG